MGPDYRWQACSQDPGLVNRESLTPLLTDTLKVTRGVQLVRKGLKLANYVIVVVFQQGFEKAGVACLVDFLGTDRLSCPIQIGP